MDRRQAARALICLGGALALPLAHSQPKVRRIGVLSSVRRPDSQLQYRIAAFEGELAKLGWEKGKHLIIDYRFAEGDPSRMVPLAKELLALHPEVAVGFAETAAATLRQLTLSIPIVFVQVADPVMAGFATNLAGPEGNITGFTTLGSSIGAKWLQAIKECAPRTNRVGIVFDTANPAWRSYVQTIESAAKGFNVTLSPLPVSTQAELATEIAGFAKLPNGALVIVPGSLTVANRAVIISLAAKHRLPAMYPYSYHVADGGLMSCGAELASLYRGAATYVDRILKGAKPSELPIQQPTRFEFAINLTTAKTLGITVPNSLLQQADKIIQ